jgi:hypothetical protein
MHHNCKGGARVARQNFSMHPDLVKAIINVTNQMNTERVDLIMANRQRRVTYSKVVASLAWLLKTRYLTPDGEVTDALRRLLEDYEATDYEQPDPYEPPEDVEPEGAEPLEIKF